MANTKIPSELIADSAITATHLSDGTISPADIAVNAITTAKIADSNITTAKLNDDAVTTAKITDANVTTAKIADDAVTTAKMADNSVTSDTIASGITLAGTTTLTSHLVMGDDDTIKLGDSGDLLIYHDGSHSYIKDAGTGNLQILATHLQINNSANSQNMITASDGGAVTLYTAGTARFNTTSTGATVTGALLVQSASSGASANTNADELVIEGSGSAGISILSGTSGDGNLFFGDSGGNVQGKVAYSHNGDYLSILSTGASLFYNGGSERMRILANGNIGIGTTSPSFSAGSGLEISRAGPATLRLEDTDGTTGATELVQVDADGYLLTRQSSSALIFGINSSEKMRLASNGYVGIGTSSPSSHLHISSASSPTLRLTDTTNTMQALFYAQDANAHLGTYSNHPLIFDSNSTERMRIAADGKVGIGTTGPDYALTVNGGGSNSAKFQTNSSAVLIGEHSSGAVIWLDGSNGDFSGGDYFGIHALGTTDLAFSYASAVGMTMKNDGKVGIGVTAPPAKLTISGNSDTSDEDCQLRIVDLDDSSGSNVPSIGFFDNSTQNARIRGTDSGIFISSDSNNRDDMYIKSDGKVILQDNASHTDDLLQIETPASGGGHGIQIRRNDSNNDQGIGRVMFGNNTDTDLATISAITDGATDNARLVFSTQPTGGSSTERMRITGGAATSSDADVIRTNSSVGIRSTHYTPFEFSGMGGHGSEINANIKKALKEAAFGSFNVNFDVGSYSNGLYYVGAGKGASTTNSYIKFKVSLSKATTMALNHQCGNSADGTTRTMNIDYSFDDLNWTQAATGTFGAGTLDQSATLNFNTIGQMSIGGVFSGDIYIRFEFKGGSSGHETLIGWRRLKLEAEAEDMQLVNPGGPGYGPVETAMFTQTSASASNIVTNNSAFVDLAQSTHGGYMNPNIFELDNSGNYGVHIKRDGKVLVMMSQDFIDSTTSGYIASRIYRSPSNDANNRVMSYELTGHTASTGQWMTLRNQCSFDVNAGDRVQFYIAGTAITNMDHGNWSQYTIMWIDSQHSGDANRAVATHQENAHFNF